MLGLTALLIGVVVVSAEPVHPVLERYPSREALQQRIDEAKRSNPEAFGLARQDFDQAIWGPRSITWATPPKRAKRLRPIKDDGPRLNVLKTQFHWERYVAKLEQDADYKQFAAYYREHIKDFCINDDNPMLELALIDVVLNGWNDWTHWDHEKPTKLRAKFPELHRVYAIRELSRLKVNDVTGILLVLLTKPEVPSYVWGAALMALEGLEDNVDQLHFVVDTAFSLTELELRGRLQDQIPKFAVWARRGARDKQKWKMFWEQYLESDVPVLRYQARRAHGLSVPDPLDAAFEQRRWIATNALDPARREKAAKAIRTRERRRKIMEHQNDR